MFISTPFTAVLAALAAISSVSGTFININKSPSGISYTCPMKETRTLQWGESCPAKSLGGGKLKNVWDNCGYTKDQNSWSHDITCDYEDAGGCQYKSGWLSNSPDNLNCETKNDKSKWCPQSIPKKDWKKKDDPFDCAKLTCPSWGLDILGLGKLVLSDDNLIKTHEGLKLVCKYHRYTLWNKEPLVCEYKADGSLSSTSDNCKSDCPKLCGATYDWKSGATTCKVVS